MTDTAHKPAAAARLPSARALMWVSIGVAIVTIVMKTAAWYVTDSVGLLSDAMKPGIHCVRTHWIRGFMAFSRVRRMRIVVPMVSACPESVSGTCRQSRRPRS